MSEHVEESEGSGSHLSPGSIIAERYRIEALLGEGGMGAVYQAQHVHMQKTFAVKVLHRHMTLHDEAVKRFEREAVAAGRIDHPNVATATDFGRLPDGSFYLVLEYVAGKTLRELLVQEGALTLERALGIARQTALGLRAAHAVQVVHRDLKPDNIMLVVREGDTELVKVLDFGIAQVKGDDTKRGPVTQFGAVFGTPQYMAPEQAAGQVVDARADLYSLGLVLDEMLRGEATFQAEELVALLSKQLIEPPPPLPTSISAPVRQLVSDLLEKDPKDRVQSAESLVSKIDVLLGTRATIPSTELGATRLAPTKLAGMPEVVRAITARIPALDRFLAGPPVAGLTRGWGVMGVLSIVTIGALSWALQGEKPRAEAVNAPRNPAAGSSREQLPSDNESEPGDEELDEKLRNLLRLARTGNRTALDALELRADEDRTLGEWLALAQGRLKIRDVEGALDALDHVLKGDPASALNPAILAGLKANAERPEFSEKILEFAADKLRSSGADLLFNIWASTSLVTDATKQAKERLFSSKVKRHWSDALGIALALREAESCEQAKALLPRAVSHADERALKPLKDLKSETGCGTNKRQDCYPCLRGDDKLDAAIQRAQMNKAPRFDAQATRGSRFDPGRWFR